MEDIIIYKDLDGKYISIKDWIKPDESESDVGASSEKEGETKAEGDDKKEDEAKEPKTVYYVSDMEQQAQYVKMFKDAGLNAICCDNFIDPHFISYLEYKMPHDVKFMRIDSDVDTALKEDAAEDSVICDIFKNALSNDKITVKTEKLKNDKVPAIINVNEQMRRYSEMGALYGMSEGELDQTLIVNTGNAVVGRIKDMDEEKQKFVASYIYSLALLSYKKLSPDELDKFISDNMTILKDF